MLETGTPCLLPTCYWPKQVTCPRFCPQWHKRESERIESCYLIYTWLLFIIFILQKYTSVQRDVKLSASSFHIYLFACFFLLFKTIIFQVKFAKPAKPEIHDIVPVLKGPTVYAVRDELVDASSQQRTMAFIIENIARCKQRRTATHSAQKSWEGS